MKRRSFLKSIGAVGASVVMPSAFNMSTMYKAANAAIDYTGASINVPQTMPQVINIFLYGGPSELSGNLTNIAEIEAGSQNSYAAAFGPGILQPQSSGGLITPNGFWSTAGGDDMEFLLTQGHMTVYRTIMKRIDGSRSHRESILMSQKGSLDIETSPGVGTRIAATLYQNRSLYQGSSQFADGTAIDFDNILLPFVSFEGDTRAYSIDPDYALPLFLRGVTLNEDFDNPFSRNNDLNASQMAEMVNKRMSRTGYGDRYKSAIEGFDIRESLASKITALNNATQDLPVVTDANDISELTASGLFDANTQRLVYPNPNPRVNQFSSRIRAAVTLAIENPSSLYITVGGGLGGWDDHNNGVSNYPDRMRQLFEALKAAMMHIKYSNGTTPGGLARITDNIVINVYGDFGRIVNLNNSQGWDHGNNQNLYTLGGAGVKSAAIAGAPNRGLGKVVGSTQLVGAPGTNNQVTEPAQGSYEAEPMSIAASVYSYFGVENPEILTADPEINPAGVPALNENA